MQITGATPAVSSIARETARRSAFLSGPVLFSFFVVCAWAVILLDKSPTPVSKQAPLSEFSAQRAAEHLSFIARAPHPIGSAEHDVVRDYIVNTLRSMGLAPQMQRTTYTNNQDGNTVKLDNIMCRLKGSSQDKALLLVAHYDSVRSGPGASDDGIAVAAFLEGAQILKSFPQLRRDVIFLFTDGEEAGLLGARAFVAEHPWAREVGVVLNFEARGTRGPSIMFETSDGNGWLIRNFGEAASHPVANSLSYEIYKRLPNNTDFTVFRREGYSGLNFAFIDGFANYHNSFDSIENADRGSLQHQGDYVIEMARQFANAASNDPQPGNLIYFDVLGKILVRYGQGIAILLLMFTGLLVAFTIYLGFRKNCLQTGNWLIGFAAMFVVVAATASGAIAVSWLAAVMGRHFSRISIALFHNSGWYVSAFSAIGLACGVALYLAIAGKIGAENLAAGSWLGWIAVIIAVSVYVPGGSYLFLWPLLFSSLGWTVVFASRQSSTSANNALLALFSLPAILIAMPMIHKIFFAFAAQSTPIVNVLLGLLLCLLLGPVAAANAKGWLLPFSLATTGLAILITAIALSGLPVHG